jgi:hypothetical protein
MTCFEIAIELLGIAASAIVTLAAAYFGAKFAFDFQNRKNKEDADLATVKGANLAIFELMRGHHNLTALQKQFIEPELGKPDKHFRILPSTSAIPHLNLNFSDLAFLLSSSDPNFLNELALAQSEINTTIDVVNARSQFHLNEFQPLLQAHHAEIGETTTLRMLEETIGVRATQMLRGLTESMITNVAEALPILVKSVARLHALTKAIYPTRAVVRMEFRSPSAEG